MQVIPVRLDDPRVAPLLAGLTAEYAARYGPGDEMTLVESAAFDPPAGRFVVVLDDEDAVIAGGGYRRHDATSCEVKRMWTRADHRRHGHAAQVLDALETAARSAGYATVRLETGPAQPEAQGLYAARGYRRIATFGRYPRALAYERRLDLATSPASASPLPRGAPDSAVPQGPSPDTPAQAAADLSPARGPR